MYGRKNHWEESSSCFYEDQRSRSLTLNSERYIEIVENFFAPALKCFSGCNQGVWLPQNEATCRTNNSIGAVGETFGKTWYPRGVITGHPAVRICPLEISLKQSYISKPGSIEDLEQSICNEMPKYFVIFQKLKPNLRTTKNRERN